MMHLHDVIKLIDDATGKEKIDVIKAHVSDELKGVVAYTYDKLMSFHITGIEPLAAPNPLFGEEPHQDRTLEDVFEYLTFMNKKGSANVEDRKLASEIHAGLNGKDQKIFELIVRRDLQCGASLKTFQKVFGKNFVPDFPCMLCSPYDEGKILNNIRFPAYSQLKSDGARCTMMITADGNTAHSRNGKKYHGLDHIMLSLEHASMGTDGACSEFVVDGELVVVDVEGNILPRQIGNGIINKATQGTISREEAERIRFIVWDYISLQAFKNGKSSIPYNIRWEALNDVVSNVGGNDVQLTECFVVDSLAAARHHYRQKTLAGEEGTILKDADGIWESKRSKTQFKFKEEHDADLIITDTYEGKKGSKYEGMIGGFIIQSSCGKVVSKVGSGLTDEMRALDPADVLGKVVEVIYNARTTSEGSDTESLFLPRVVEIRHDKDKFDSRDDMIAAEEASRQVSEG